MVVSISQVWLMANSREWGAAQAGVLGVADAVLDSGVGTVACFEERHLSGARVGDEGLVAPAVGLLEQRELSAGVGRSRRTMTRIPSGQADRSRSPVSSATSPPARMPPSASVAGVHTCLGTSARASRIFSVIANPTL